MCIKYLILLDTFSVLVILLQAQMYNTEQENVSALPSLLPIYSYIPVLQYPRAPVLRFLNSKCKFPCTAESKIDDKVHYDVFYKPSDVLLKNSMNAYHNAIYNHKLQKQRQLKETDNGKDNRPNHHSSEARGGGKKLMPNYPRVPATYLQPPKEMNANYQTYLKEKDKKRTAEKVQEKNLIGNHTKNIELSNEQKNITNSNKLEGYKDNSGPTYIRDHAPEYYTEETIQVRNVNDSKNDKGKYSPSPLELSPDGDRVEFHVQGHKGTRTYIFGFDTGNGKNRQYRLEERLADGTVNGHYGYYDAKGKLRTVKYVARPLEGYQERHHETIHSKSND